MIHRLRHRGPDDEGVLQLGPCTLGAARLSQLDRAGGTQPMRSPDGRWTVVFNGGIHNHRALRRDLAAEWNFQTRSDTEVLLAAIASWGLRALPKLNGMFAFVAWDAFGRRAWMVRDRLGVKPLLWSRRGDGSVAFASEAKALVTASPRVNDQAILEHLVAPCFSGVGQAMFADIEVVPPGHAVAIDEHGMRSQEWWRYDLHRAQDEDEESLVAAIREALPRVMGRTLDFDERAAVMLSGGLDSTLLASLAREHGVTHACTIAFEGQERFDYERALMVKSDDLPCAIDAAKEMNLEHRIVHVNRDEFADDLRTLSVQNDALPAWEQELAQHHLGRALAADGCRAVIVGDAADETHFGYGFMLDERSTSHMRVLLGRFGQAPVSAAMRSRAQALPDDFEAWLRDAGHTDAGRAGRLRAITHVVTRLWLPRLLHNGDIHLMAHGVEARVPFADAELLEIAVKVHPLLALRDNVEKAVLREAARGLMPERARVRRKSSLSKDDGSAAVLQAECGKAMRAAPELLGHWLDLPALERLCDVAHVPTEMERALLFRIVCLGHWAEAYHVRLS